MDGHWNGYEMIKSGDEAPGPSALGSAPAVNGVSLGGGRHDVGTELVLESQRGCWSSC